MRVSGYYTIILFSFICFICCSPSKQTSKVRAYREVHSNSINPSQPEIPLSQYLQRIPGIQVLGRGPDKRVLIRGNNSLNEESEPLFIIDGLNIGFGYQKAEPLVDVNDIANIRVLKSGVDTASYGMLGNNGVVIITTKRN